MRLLGVGMYTQPDFENCQPQRDSYTYPQFIIINETTGQIEVDFIDKDSGRVVRHIPSTELKEIVHSYYLLRQEVKSRGISE